MKTVKLTTTVLVGMTLMFTAATVSASDPVAIYAIVQRVIFEPNDKAPERIQIWGVFAIADTARGGNYYTKPQRGYLYYSLPKGKESVALKEWADFKAVAGTGQAVERRSDHVPAQKPSRHDDRSGRLLGRPLGACGGTGAGG